MYCINYNMPKRQNNDQTNYFEPIINDYRNVQSRNRRDPRAGCHSFGEYWEWPTVESSSEASAIRIIDPNADHDSILN